jgi:saccharopine dehydrogenase-like NADP-dependent oxidoreductase
VASFVIFSGTSSKRRHSRASSISIELQFGACKPDHRSKSRGEIAMHSVMIVGAGRIGTALAELLGRTPDYAITVVDSDRQRLERVAANADGLRLRTRALDVGDVRALAQALHGHFAIVSAAPFHLTDAIAGAARAAGVHYLDLTEDVAMTRAVRALADGAETAFIPQCGLAPGFISIVASDLARRFDTLDSLHLRVGALPRYPSNGLSYNLTWSTEGVINEYCQPCEAIVDGVHTELPPLEHLEHFSVDGVRYEAFNTSGGLGTLCETYAGNLRSLNYKSIRYPGHRDIMKVLVSDLRLGSRRALFKDVLEGALPATEQDLIVIFVTASGFRDGVLVQESYANRLYPRQIGGRCWSAIQLATSSSACAVLDLLRDARLPQQGFVRQEQIALHDFLGNRFGAFYARTGEDTAMPEAGIAGAGTDRAA